MKHFKQTFQLILVSSLLLAIAHSLSKPIALQPDTTYQTGVQTIITTNFTSTAEVVYNIPYTSVMTTSSLNASLGIYGLNYYMINKVFGWKYFVSSLTNVDIIIHLSVYTANSPLYYLKLCYIISSNPDIDMSYVEYTFNPTDVLANQGLSNSGNSNNCWSTNCRFYSTTQTYTNKPSATVRTFLSGFYVATFASSSGNIFGIKLNPSSNPGLSSFNMSITVYGRAQITFISFYYISYDTAALNVLYSKTTIDGRETVGCGYPQNNCNSGNTNNNFNTDPTSVLNYFVGEFFMGIDTMIIPYSGSTGSRGQFDVTGISQNSDTTLKVTISFSGNSGGDYSAAYSYFSMQTFYCKPAGPDLYYVYGSNLCDSACNGTISQFMNSTNYCQPCGAVCYQCVGSQNFCTSCYNSQNRVLNGNNCVCDISAGFYDDLTSNICPKCHYSCKTCNGGGSSSCLSCNSVSNRYKNINTCPCLIGYYDPGASICVACHYTCQTATCTGTSITSCASCNAAKFRATIASNFTCQCQSGYYDNNTSTQQCSPCRYSCLTCTGTNSYCTSCSGANFRSINNTDHTCPCNTGYYDNNVTLCLQCDSTCLTCSGGQTYNCLTCDGTAHRQLSVTSCVCANYYYDLNKVCTACYYSCLTCSSNTATTCLTCSAASHRTFNATSGECLCDFGYVDMGVLSCQACSASCLTCIYNTTSCSLCHNTTGRYLAGYSCLCQSNYVDLTFNGVCTPCHYSCLTCFDGTVNGCSTCSNNRTLTSNACKCPTGWYDNGFSVICQICNSYCASCVNGLTSGCTACQPLYYRTLNPSPTGTCICKTGYYDIGGLLCSACDSKCQSCVTLSTTCTSCDSVTNRRAISSNFTCDCTIGYYDTGAAVCSACVTTCVSCIVISSNCTSCPSNRYLLNNSCYCNGGTYENNLAQCVACSISCLTCVNSSTTCLTCPTNANRYQISTTCPCLPGFFDNGVTICPKCNYTCANCSTWYVCTDCQLNSYRTLQPAGTCPCDAGYYDNGNIICAKCSPFCLTCLTYTQCKSCVTSDFRTLNALSFSCPCDPGYYQNGINTTCSACHYSCATCYAGLSTNCYTCTSLRTFTMPYSCPCSTGFYESGTVCTPCSISCKTCNVLSTNCTSCPATSYLSNFQCICLQGYYLNGLVCSQCNIQCQSCITTSTFCQSCNPLHGTVLNGSSCVCNSNQYQNGTNYICVTCNPYCLTCTSNTNYSCLSCYSYMQRSFSGTTKSCQCNPGYYDSGSLVCSSCVSPCATCIGGSVYNCTTCISGYHLVGSSCMATVVCSNYFWNGVCLDVCPNTTFPGVNICNLCINNCLTCTSTTFCTSCKSNFYLYMNTCYWTCPASTYSNFTSSSCTACPSSCSNCIQRNTSLVCLTCNIGYVLFNDQCINNCSTVDQTYVIINGMCKPCLYQCATCSSLSVNGCITCNINYNFYLGMCLSQCPLGYYGLNKICTLCNSNCTTCNTTGCKTCNTGFYLNANLQCVLIGYFRDSNNINVKCHPNCQTCTNSSFSSCILCSSYRGDSSQKAVSGYCDCWKGSIDVGNGKCDIQSYKSIQKANQALVSTTTSLNYLSGLSGVICVNFFTPVMLASYQQLYSNFYYLNSSAVLQTDQVLNSYGDMCFNKLMQKQTNKNVKKYSRAFSRLLLQNLSQQQQSLFMRGYSWNYLIDWGLYTFICIVIVWLICLILTPIINKSKKCLSKQSITLTILNGILFIFKENIIIVLHLLTFNDIGFYALASFKLINSVNTQINIFKLVLSAALFAYYLLYLLRLFIVGVKFVGNQEQQQKFMVLFSCFYSHKKKQALCRIYVPMMMLRSFIISICLVFLAFNPIGQIVSTLLVFILFTVYSFFFCPYYYYLSIFVHIFEGLFILQLLLLTISVAQPQSSKLGPAFGLIIINYLQLLNFLVLTIIVMLNKIYDIKCWQIKQKRILPFKKQGEDEQVHIPVYRQRKAIKVINEVEDTIISQPDDQKMDNNILKHLNKRTNNKSEASLYTQQNIHIPENDGSNIGRRRRKAQQTQNDNIDIFSLEDMADMPKRQSTIRQKNRRDGRNKK